MVGTAHKGAAFGPPEAPAQTLFLIARKQSRRYKAFYRQMIRGWLQVLADGDISTSGRSQVV